MKAKTKEMNVKRIEYYLLKISKDKKIKIPKFIRQNNLKIKWSGKSKLTDENLESIPVKCWSGLISFLKETCHG